ncbi:MAG: sigma 54-interacting transcriptional regulator [Nitrospirota bacterium]|nr:sigma 54-interacting transcriptional regulator [Nitrospirota bacterium]
MSGILYLNNNFLEAGRVCTGLWKEFDISLCTDIDKSRNWIDNLQPEILVVQFDPDFPGLGELLGGFLKNAEGNHAIILHRGKTKLEDAESIRKAIGSERLSCRVVHADYDLASIRRALQSVVKTGLKPSGKAVLHGVSQAIVKTNLMLEKFAMYEYPVLICGESGTGKEIAAQRIHAASARSRNDLVALDCGALPEALAEGMLFGSDKGAFTDALDHKGAIEEAEQGTLFLDEIGNLPLPCQCKLLRVLESGDYRRLGGKKNRAAEFRLVSATSLDLGNAARLGGFRLDLFHRINTLVLDIPPLRARPEDIEPIAVQLCLKHSNGRCIPGNLALEKLVNHDWPGNVRELRNTIQRAIVISGGQGELGAEDIMIL